jgi:hypothetical protein
MQLNHNDSTSIDGWGGDTYLQRRKAREVGRLEYHSTAILRISWETKYSEYGYCRRSQQLHEISLQIDNGDGLPSVGILEESKETSESSIYAMG